MIADKDRRKMRLPAYHVPCRGHEKIGFLWLSFFIIIIIIIRSDVYFSLARHRRKSVTKLIFLHSLKVTKIVWSDLMM